MLFISQNILQIKAIFNSKNAQLLEKRPSTVTDLNTYILKIITSSFPASTTINCCDGLQQRQGNTKLFQPSTFLFLLVN